jgi:hypothetical protein
MYLKSKVCFWHYDLLNYWTYLSKRDIFKKLIIQLWWQSPTFLLSPSQKDCVLTKEADIKNRQCCLKWRLREASWPLLEARLFQWFVSYLYILERFCFSFTCCWWLTDLWKKLPSVKYWLIDWFTIGFETLWSWCTEAWIHGPFVPHINSWEPCYFAKVPNGSQTYTLNVLWIQEEGAQIYMSEWSQGFTFTKNMGRGFNVCSTPPT